MRGKVLGDFAMGMSNRTAGRRSTFSNKNRQAEFIWFTLAYASRRSTIRCRSQARISSGVSKSGERR